MQPGRTHSVAEPDFSMTCYWRDSIRRRRIKRRRRIMTNCIKFRRYFRFLLESIDLRRAKQKSFGNKDNQTQLILRVRIAAWNAMRIAGGTDAILIWSQHVAWQREVPPPPLYSSRNSYIDWYRCLLRIDYIWPYWSVITVGKLSFSTAIPTKSAAPISAAHRSPSNRFYSTNFFIILQTRK